MQFNFSEEAKKYETEGGSTFKFKEGANPMRVLSKTIRHVSAYKGNITTKYLAYILDRADGKIKIAFLPYTILKMLGDLQSNPEYAFDQVPMPYDITITATGAGTKEVNYSIVPARNNTALTVEEENEYSKQKPLEEVQRKLLEKSLEKPTAQGTADEYMPFPEPNNDIRIENVPNF